jgi:hypothetical protein
MKSDRSITVIDHAMSLTVLYSLNQVKFKVFEKKNILSDSYWISDELTKHKLCTGSCKEYLMFL